MLRKKGMAITDPSNGDLFSSKDVVESQRTGGTGKKKAK
jgi:hypothetical protein